jgi:hypothetical protein
MIGSRIAAVWLVAAVGAAQCVQGATTSPSPSPSPEPSPTFPSPSPSPEASTTWYGTWFDLTLPEALGFKPVMGDLLQNSANPDNTRAVPMRGLQPNEMFVGAGDEACGVTLGTDPVDGLEAGIRRTADFIDPGVDYPIEQTTLPSGDTLYVDGNNPSARYPRFQLWAVDGPNDLTAFILCIHTDPETGSSFANGLSWKAVPLEL